MKAPRLLFIFLLAYSLNISGQGISIHISPAGSDDNDGTKENPVASIQKAQSLIKDIKKGHPKDSIFVLLHQGVYRLKKGLVIGAEDGGTKESPIVFRNYKNDEVTISGAVSITQYQALSKDHPLYKIHPAIGNKIIEMDLEESGISTFEKLRLSGFSGSDAPKHYTLRELYFNGKSMPLSRWPNNGFSEFTGVVTEGAETTEKTGIIYQDTHISSWINEPNILLHGYWKYLWADAYEQVDKIDTTNKTIWLSPPYNHYRFQKNHPFAAYNIISEIDQAGEWAYDYQNRKIYFYPPEGVDQSSLELSVCEEPLLTFNNTQWMVFRGICFEMSAGEGILISNSESVTLNHCKIRACARDGIIINGGRDLSISSCEISGLGRGAIRIDGGDRETLEKSGFLIDNCHIHHLSRIDRTYTPGIWVDGVGTRITHCQIHDIPSSAMRINGNDHSIEYNEMFKVVTESDDQGAIDMWGDPTYRGNVIRYNYIHDVGPYKDDEVNAHCGRAGIRLDDAISGTIIYGNIFKDCAGGNFGAIQIHGGKENLIQNNLFYQCSTGLSFTPWDIKHWKKYTKKSLGILERNKELYTSHYPKLKELNKNMNKNTATQNIFIDCQRLNLRMPKTVRFTDNIEVNRDESMSDSEEQDYFIKEMSEIQGEINFEPIDIKKIGLKNKTE